MDTADLHAELHQAEQLFQSLGDWNDTAKLRGKILAIAAAIRRRTAEDDLASIRSPVADLEQALRRLQEGDPLTRLVNHVTAWRATLERHERVKLS